MTKPTLASDSGMSALMLTLVVAAVLGLLVVALQRRNLDVTKESLVLESSDRNLSAAQNIASIVRALIADERVAVTPTLEFAKGPSGGAGSLPEGWSVADGAIETRHCDFKTFAPDKGDSAFSDTQAGSSLVCTSDLRRFSVHVLGLSAPSVLRIKISTKDAKLSLDGGTAWSTTARLTVSGCLLPFAKKSVSFEAKFDKLAPSCPFGDLAHGNLGPINGHMTARVDRSVSLGAFIPKGAEVCSLSLSSKPSLTPMYYDDHLFLTLSGALLMTTNQFFFPLFKSGPGDFKIYDWSRVVGKSAVTNDTFAVCSGAKPLGCIVPATEKPGGIYLAFEDRAIRAMAEWVRAKGTPFSLGLTVAGDDNPEKDCQVSELTMVGSATYIE